ncbi:Uu.00g002530.m01.CDS01 [Anthostomella pinea]|uniref:Uu.00g002530.m01.CDS01 n=1 Tax=Anthostomella pinea TaxID=933095 RepID=A0AAI8YIR6_9PEZI|nr:Uu.00g002530.m01.CDS01 [Anthostomella pinea]
MSDNYKRLLPAPMLPLRGHAESSSSSSSSAAKTSEPPTKKRTVSKAACNNCRVKKIRCDNKRPVCTACARAGTDCSFVTATSDETPFMALKREVEHHKHLADSLLGLYDLLRSASDSVVLDIVRRLKAIRNTKAGADGITDVVAAVNRELEHESPLRARFSNGELMQSFLPESREQTESELMIRCASAYPSLVPIEFAFMNLSDMLKLPALLHTEAKPTTPMKRAASQTDHGSVSATSSESDAQGSSMGVSETQMTSSFDLASIHDSGQSVGVGSVEQVDQRLMEMDISKWTNVPISNELAATLITLYLDIEHPWCTLFDADLFLDDLLTGTTHFCSRLLVNSILSWICMVQQCEPDLQAEVDHLSPDFEKEAVECWATEKHTNTLTAAAAAQLLSNVSAFRGRHEFSVECEEEGIRMGTRMGLFGVRSEYDSAMTWLDDHDDWLRAACHTSWGIFTCVCIRSLRYHRARLVTPPMLPIPGQYFETHTWSEHPQNAIHKFVPTSRVGGIFNAMCYFGACLHSGSGFMYPSYNNLTSLQYVTLRVPQGALSVLPDTAAMAGNSSIENLIVHDILWAYFDTGHGVPVERATVDFAERTYLRLLGWAMTLPMELARGDGIRRSVLALHAYFHCVTMELFRPFLFMSAEDLPPMNFQHLMGSPKDVYGASVKQLKRLVLTDRIHLNGPSASIPWHIALLYLANAMISPAPKPEDPNHLDCHFFFLFCIVRYLKLYQSFPVVDKTILGLLSMALRNGLISAKEMDVILEHMRKIGRQYDMTDAAEAYYIIDLDLATSQPREAQGEALARQFHELILFQEMMTGVLPQAS